MASTGIFIIWFTYFILDANFITSTTQPFDQYSCLDPLGLCCYIWKSFSNSFDSYLLKRTSELSLDQAKVDWLYWVYTFILVPDIWQLFFYTQIEVASSRNLDHPQVLIRWVIHISLPPLHSTTSTYFLDILFVDNSKDDPCCAKKAQQFRRAGYNQRFPNKKNKKSGHYN